MKKLIFVSAVVFTLSATVNAQITPAALKTEMRFDKKVENNMKAEKKEDRRELKKLKGDDVNNLAKTAFKTDFPGIVPTQWERLDNFDEATFIKHGQVVSAFYDWNAKLVCTTQNKKFSDLPAKAQQYISKKYTGYTPGDVLLCDDNEDNETDMILYNNQFADRDSYFVELQNNNKKIVVQVDMDGTVEYYTRLK